MVVRTELDVQELHRLGPDGGTGYVDPPTVAFEADAVPVNGAVVRRKHHAHTAGGLDRDLP
jgi:hypothetical protein